MHWPQLATAATPVTGSLNLVAKEYFLNLQTSLGLHSSDRACQSLISYSGCHSSAFQCPLAPLCVQTPIHPSAQFFLCGNYREEFHINMMNAMQQWVWKKVLCSENSHAKTLYRQHSEIQCNFFTFTKSIPNIWLFKISYLKFLHPTIMTHHWSLWFP